MLGLVVTGHGEFSNGLIHAARMIAGAQDHVTYVPFADGMDLEVLQAQISEQVQQHIQNYGGVVILTDLKGGTPFNVSMMATHGLENVAVLSGTNLPMVIEGTLLAQFNDEAATLATQLIATGQAGIDWPQLPATKTENSDDEDGI